jgi:hypothetical protein
MTARVYDMTSVKGESEMQPQGLISRAGTKCVVSEGYDDKSSAYGE